MRRIFAWATAFVAAHVGVMVTDWLLTQLGVEHARLVFGQWDRPLTTATGAEVFALLPILLSIRFGMAFERPNRSARLLPQQIGMFWIVFASVAIFGCCAIAVNHLIGYDDWVSAGLSRSLLLCLFGILVFGSRWLNDRLHRPWRHQAVGAMGAVLRLASMIVAGMIGSGIWTFLDTPPSRQQSAQATTAPRPIPTITAPQGEYRIAVTALRSCPGQTLLERDICADPELALLDDELSLAFRDHTAQPFVHYMAERDKWCAKQPSRPNRKECLLDLGKQALAAAP